MTDYLTTDKIRELLDEITPGNWEERFGLVGLYIEGRHQWTQVASVNDFLNDRGGTPIEGKANARLIVAAPELVQRVLDLTEALGKAEEKTETLIREAVKEERKACVKRIKMVEYLTIEELTEALEGAVEEKTQERG